MRYGLVLTTVFIAAGIGLGAPSHVSAELTPELGALVALSGDVETSTISAATTTSTMAMTPAAKQFPLLLSRLRSSYRLQSLKHGRSATSAPASGELRGIPLFGTASIASTRATTALTWGRGHNEGCQRRSGRA